MSRSQSLLAIHLVAICFGTCGILGELIQADATIITWGRSLFAVMTLAVFSRVAGVSHGAGVGVAHTNTSRRCCRSHASRDREEYEDHYGNEKAVHKHILVP